MSKLEGGPARWKKGEEHALLKTRVLEVWSRHYTHPGRGAGRDFVVVKAPDWVNVLALTSDGKLVLVRQFRHGINDLSLEVPGGVVEVGEDPVAAGVRELQEETGYAGHGARMLAWVHPNPAIQNNHCKVVLVEGVAPSGTTEWDPDEEIEVVVLPVEEVLAAARSGKITHSLTLVSLFFLEGLRSAAHLT